MAKKHPITKGEVFGRLTVIGPAPKNEGDIHRRVYARCKCGEIRNIMFSLLVTGKTVSCGCYRRTKNITHGHASEHNGNRTYYVYRDMLNRCNNKKYKEYYLYGGRGIQVCARWKERYENFLEDMGIRPEGMSLDRIDNDGDYEPSNCRWATIYDQANNKRNNVVLEYNCRTQTAAQWARELNISVWNIYARKKRGWSDERILSTP